MKKQRSQKKSNVPTFVSKLYKLLEKPQNQNILRWGKISGSFQIIDLPSFTDKLLPELFHHHNFDTFVRQLYNYEFKKYRNQHADHCYCHNSFLKEKPTEMKKIKRKTPKRKIDSQDEDFEAYQEEIQEIQALREQQHQFNYFLQSSLKKLKKMEKQNQQLRETILQSKSDNSLLENILGHFTNIQSESFYGISFPTPALNYRYCKQQLQQLIVQSVKFEYLVNSTSNMEAQIFDVVNDVDRVYQKIEFDGQSSDKQEVGTFNLTDKVLADLATSSLDQNCQFF